MGGGCWLSWPWPTASVGRGGGGGWSLPEADMRRAVNLGLVEAGRDPATTEPRYFVSPLLDVALRRNSTTPNELEASRRGGRHLYRIWWKTHIRGAGFHKITKRTKGA